MQILLESLFGHAGGQVRQNGVELGVQVDVQHLSDCLLFVL